MCLQIEQQFPKNIKTIMIEGEKHIVGYKSFIISMNEWGLTLSARYVDSYDYQFKEHQFGRISISDKQKQEMYIYANHSWVNCSVSLGYHAYHLLKKELPIALQNSNFINEYDEKIYILAIPIIIPIIYVELFGRNDDLTCSRFIIPTPAIFNKYLKNLFTLIYDLSNYNDYQVLYNSILNNNLDMSFTEDDK